MSSFPILFPGTSISPLVGGTNLQLHFNSMVLSDPLKKLES